MLLTLGKNIDIGRQIRLALLMSLCAGFLVKPVVSSDMYEGDECEMKSMPGVCTLASKCTTLENAVKRGEISQNDVVFCGLGKVEEIICCPTNTVNRGDTTTQKPDVLVFDPSEQTVEFTTKRDFWLDLLTTTTTTTLRPLVIGGKELNTDTEYFDLTKLLNQSGSSESMPFQQPGNNLVNWENERFPQQRQGNQFNDVRNVEQQWTQNRSPNRFPNGETIRPSQQNVVAFPNNRNVDANNPNPLWFGKRRLNTDVEINNDLMQSQFQNQQSAPLRDFNTFAPNQPNNGWSGPNIRNPQNQILNTNNSQKNQRIIKNSHQHAGRRVETNEWSNPNWSNSGNGADNNFQNNFQQPPLDETNVPRNRPRENRNNGEFGQNLPNIIDFPNHSISGANTPAFNARQPNRELNHPLRSPNINENPISVINENLIKAGIDIVEAKFESVDREWEQHQQSFNSPPHRGAAPTPIVHSFNDFINTENTNNFQNPQGGGGVRLPVTERVLFNNPSSTKSSTTTTTTKSPIVTRSKERPAVQACRKIDEGLVPLLTPHIIGGTPADLGEYPHMVAIGYTTIGNDQSYDFRCGGSLIDKKFVLTAAHCVNSINNQPSIVRMGVVNFTDPEQMRNVVQIPILYVHIHQNYSDLYKLNDIAIIELLYDAKFSNYIYPACVYSEIYDPPIDSTLSVTGFGYFIRGSHNSSNVLLKANQQIDPLPRCYQTYRSESFQLDTGHLCAFDPVNFTDACQGDSGGPLNLIVDQNARKYRIVGIVSAGFNCGSKIPGLYTRVAKYLDFIEKIVWPNL